MTPSVVGPCFGGSRPCLRLTLVLLLSDSSIHARPTSFGMTTTANPTPSPRLRVGSKEAR